MGTTVTTIANRALQKIGGRTLVTDAELLASSTNEAIQLNLCIYNLRDDLLRMAPWNCAFKPAPLVYITSLPGTPENTQTGVTEWSPGLPAPPWSYEFQYPADCLRACYIRPRRQYGFAGGVPLTPVDNAAYPYLGGGQIKFAVQTDEFYPVTAAAVVSGGTGHAVGDIITLPYGPAGSAPIGAPAKLEVTAVAAGVITTVAVVSQIDESDPAKGGSYFSRQTNPVAQDTTTGSGTGATFNLTYGSKGSQRVVLTNEEFPILYYCKRIDDPDVMDTLFQSAWSSAVAATICQALTGDKKMVSMLVDQVNRDIETARNPDGNEGLTINDVNPDWIRARGYSTVGPLLDPYAGFDWGPLWPGA